MSNKKASAVIAAAAVLAASGAATAEATATKPGEGAAGPRDGQPVTVPGVRVVSRPASFRRAGYEFTGEPKEIPLTDLSDEQLQLLWGEKNLVVVDCQIAVAG